MVGISWERVCAWARVCMCLCVSVSFRMPSARLRRHFSEPLAWAPRLGFARLDFSGVKGWGEGGSDIESERERARGRDSVCLRVCVVRWCEALSSGTAFQVSLRAKIGGSTVIRIFRSVLGFWSNRCPQDPAWKVGPSSSDTKDHFCTAISFTWSELPLELMTPSAMQREGCEAFPR